MQDKTNEDFEHIFLEVVWQFNKFGWVVDALTVSPQAYLFMEHLASDREIKLRHNAHYSARGVLELHGPCGVIRIYKDDALKGAEVRIGCDSDKPRAMVRG
jgi:hypothetical protein